MALTLRTYNKKAIDKICQDKGFGSYARAMKWLIENYEPRNKEMQRLQDEINALKTQLDTFNGHLSVIRDFGNLMDMLIEPTKKKR